MKTLKKNNISQGSSINSPVPVNKNCDLPPFFNPDYFGHVVVQTLGELESIPCKLRQDGMVATVVQEDYSDYQLQASRTGLGICDNNSWVKVSIGDEVFNGGNLFLFQTEEQANEFMGSTQSKEGQIIYISDLDSYFKFDGQDGLTDAFPNKLDKPTVQGLDNPNYKIPAYLDGKPYWRSSSDFEKVKSVNGKIGKVVLKTSDLENDSDYTTNATLTVHTSNKSNPHNVTKSQIGLGNVDNTSDLNKPISTATQTELNKKLDKPTTNNTNQFVILGDGSTAPKNDLGKNFANTDLTVSVNRKHTGTASVEFGFPFNCSNPSIRYSGLVDKSTDATFNQLLGVDSNGYAAKVGLNAVTNAMSKSTDAQKDAWREASRKTGETYSISQARVDAVLPPILLDTNKNITILGINLFLNTTGNVAKVETLHSVTLAVVEVITNISVHQTMPSQLSIEINRELYETDVNYYIRVTHNGIESIVNRSASFIIPSNFNSQPLVLGWKLRTMRSKIEPTSYSMTEGQYGSLNLISKGVNNVGQYESGRINAFTDYILTNDEEYVFQINATGWGQQFGSRTWTDDDMFFGITPLETIPENEDTLIHLTNNLIFSGGNSANGMPVGFKLLAVAGTENTTTQGIAIFFTLIIGKGVMKAIYNNNIIIRNLPTSLTGKYKLFANMSGTSEVTRRIDINITSFYKK